MKEQAYIMGNNKPLLVSVVDQDHLGNQYVLSNLKSIVVKTNQKHIFDLCI